VTELRLLLWPVSVLFGWVVRLRAGLYRKGVLRRWRLQGVVLSVGNLTVGGTAKTPMVLWLAERLAAEGKRVGILTRGYSGFLARRTRNVPAAQLYYHNPEHVRGDEVCLILRRLQRRQPSLDRPMVGVGPNRYAKGRELERHGVEWFILDDGFQHLRLARDVDIVLIDATDPFGSGHLLPAGRLREPKSALGRADLILITRSDHAPAVETVIRRHSAASIFYAETELDGIFVCMGNIPGDTQADWREKKLFAFCGIGNPAAFFADLRRWGLHIVGQAAYRDHHRYSRKDAQKLERQAQAAGADALICTEKDLCNLLRASFQALPVLYCGISLRIPDADGFSQALLAALERGRLGVEE